MAGNTVTVPTAANLVVTHYICIPATLRTLISLSEQGEPQPIPERVSKLLVVDIKAEGGRGDNIKPVSSMREAGREGQSFVAGVRNQSNKLVIDCVVDGN